MKETSNSVTVRYYPTKVKGRTYWTICWLEAGSRRRKVISGTMADAKAWANAKAKSLDVALPMSAVITSAEHVEFARARQLAGSMPLDTVAAQWVEASKVAPLADLVSFWVARHPSKSLTVAEAVRLYLEDKAKRNRTKIYLDCLKFRLNRFVRDHSQFELAHLTTQSMTQWIDSLKVEARTHNNYRSSIVTLVNHAKTQGWVPKDWDQADAIPTVEEGDKPVKIYTPAELSALLSAAMPFTLPSMVLSAFAGVRMGETCDSRMDWSDVTTNAIVVGRQKVRGAGRRLVPAQPAIFAWLTNRPATGAICSAKQSTLSSRILERYRERKLEWKRNALRHSYISYRLAIIKDVPEVALECGTSAAMIYKHYREVATEVQAKAWFSTAPECHNPSHNDLGSGV